MAKYEQPFEDIQALYDEMILKADLKDKINFTILADNNAKDIFKINKANELLKYRTGDDIIIVINEKIFDKLTKEQKTIVVAESLVGIHYDSEKDRVVISKPDVVTFSGILREHSFDKWNVLRESIRSLYDAENENENQPVIKNRK